MFSHEGKGSFPSRQKGSSSGRGDYPCKDQGKESQVSEDKLVIQRKSRSLDVIVIQSIFESVPRGEATQVCSEKKMLMIPLESHCVNVNVQSWLSDFTMGKGTSQ